MGTMSRTITLPTNTNKDKVHAEYTNGVLHVQIPKIHNDEEKPKKMITVK